MRHVRGVVVSEEGDDIITPHAARRAFESRTGISIESLVGLVRPTGLEARPPAPGPKSRPGRLRVLLREYLAAYQSEPELAERRALLPRALVVAGRVAADLRTLSSREGGCERAHPGLEALRSHLGWSARRWRELREVAADLERKTGALASAIGRPPGAPARLFGRFVAGVADLVRTPREMKDEHRRTVALFLAGLAEDTWPRPWRRSGRGRRRETVLVAGAFDIELRRDAESGNWYVNLTQLTERVRKILGHRRPRGRRTRDSREPRTAPVPAA